MMTDYKKTKIGVIGVGHLGQHHVKHYRNMPSVELVGIFDTDKSRCMEIAAKYHITNFESGDKLIGEVDALSIVTPTPKHFIVAEAALKAGKHVFIEKPITESVEEANRLLHLASQKEVIVQVGHIERLNPALIAMKDIVLNPKFIEVQRLAPYTARGTEVPVVLDLMIHDIDILMSLVKSPIKNIHASGVSIMTDSVDIGHARLRFENGTVASVTSSRVAKDKVRKIKIFQKDMYITIDFLLGLTEKYQIVDKEAISPNVLYSADLKKDGRKQKIVYEKLPVIPGDALEMELNNFVESVQGRAIPIVDGKAGRDALDVAIKIHDMILEDIN